MKNYIMLKKVEIDPRWDKVLEEIQHARKARGSENMRYFEALDIMIIEETRGGYEPNGYRDQFPLRAGEFSELVGPAPFPRAKEPHPPRGIAHASYPKK